ncbi:hypothetical protein ANCCEY_04936 [Ancylostoma ceylanicum]|uniref:HAD hydrolase, family IA, variant 3 n=1 Tax=Ancylostoma ceylanicum TaxID=53326 RepID=A0A0D6M0U5_9BILA|nr:hypothetical protein ANCCEY_04936 [Ancylostoma ceylanicum]
MAVTHVIFDFDGLLVDTEPCYKAVHKELLGRYGHTFTPEIGSLIQLNIADKITPREYMAEYDAMLTEMYRHCQPMPGAERLVRHFHDKGIPMAMCSGSRKSMYGPRREPHKAWLDLIPFQVFCGDEPDIKHGKPHPDGFLATMNRVTKVLNSLEEFRPEEFGLPAFD